MRSDTVIVAGIVVAAIAYLLRRAWRQARARKAAGPDCDHCAH